MTTCDTVLERVALGEPLGELADHVASCPHCRRVAALPVELGAAKRDADPGAGFAARVTAGAQRRFGERRRRRVVVGVAAVAVGAAAAGLLFVALAPDRGAVATAPAVETPAKSPEPAPAVDPDVATLVHFARVGRSSHASAHWKHITEPLVAYHALVKGVRP